MEEGDLEFIPRSVRDKLDRIGVKLHLQEWRALSSAERHELVDLACESAGEIDHYRQRLLALIRPSEKE